MASMDSCQFNMDDLDIGQNNMADLAHSQDRHLQLAPSQNFLAPCQVGHFVLARCQEILANCQVSILLGIVPKSGFCFFRILRRSGDTLRDVWRSSDRWFFR
ncbi:rh157.2 [macacine betaherpesvirus 3]|uniref:Rh157.2 n=1 Tax=Rhesus cytomegalovirus (strain 68-1) TaxID=47929 RepID=Q2FAE3_RHCM6|nr:rh157.2 [macacine betaherpesvirus 3]